MKNKNVGPSHHRREKWKGRKESTKVEPLSTRNKFGKILQSVSGMYTERSEMIIFKSLLTTFEASSIFEAAVTKIISSLK